MVKAKNGHTAAVCQNIPLIIGKKIKSKFPLRSLIFQLLLLFFILGYDLSCLKLNRPTEKPPYKKKKKKVEFHNIKILFVD